MTETRSGSGNAAIASVVRRLKDRYGDDWSFDIVDHALAGGAVRVVGVLNADGTEVRETGSADGKGRLSLGEQLESAANDSLRKCAAVLLGAAVVEKKTAAAHAAAKVKASAEDFILPTADAAAVEPAAAPKAAQAAIRTTDHAYDRLDPVTLRVVGGAFNAIAKEMAHVLYRMSYSSIIRESEDLGCGIFDIDGSELCESDSTPMHIGSLPWYIRGILARLAGDIADGDVIIHNHPYHGASHTPDLAVVTPIFHHGRMLGFAACTAHLLDLGGAAPGINVDVFDVFAEAKLFNAVKLHDRGRRNGK
jgi:hypothetical protein